MTAIRAVEDEEQEQEVTVDKTEDPILKDLHQRITLLRRQERELNRQLESLSDERKRYEKALKVLQQQPLRVRAPRAPREKREQHTRIGVEKLTMIRQAILGYAETHEEFRQVDIRSLVKINSSAAAVAFEKLRQDNVIRFARKDGNNKWYRLTREALKDGNGQA